MDPEHVRLVKEGELFKNCTNIVLGKGNLSSDILFVGEAPGKNEDLEGLPFVGKAGIANILKCRPPENRDPSSEEIRAHTPWLVHQIKEMKPKVICSLGNYATKFFLALGNVEEMKDQPGITSVHGKVREIEFFGIKVKLIPLFHPAAIIYNRSIGPLWEKDMEIVKQEVLSK